MSAHNTPFGDIVDTEDDLQPLVASMFRDANRAVRLVAGAMGPARSTREDGGARRRGLDHGHRAGRYAGTGPRRAVQGGPPSPSGSSRNAIASAEPRSSVLREVSVAVLGRPIEYDEPALTRF